MELQKDATHQPGRWVLAPKKGGRFVGTRERARLRARERRRRIVVVMLEAIGLTALIGIFPPLRPMLFVTAFLALLLIVYLALVAVMVSRGALDADTLPAPLLQGTVMTIPQPSMDPSIAGEQERLARVVGR